MRFVLSLILFTFLFCANLYSQSGSASGSWGSQVGLGTFQFLPSIESGQLVTLYTDIPLSDVTSVSHPIPGWCVIFGQIGSNYIPQNSLNPEPVAIKLFANGGNYVGKIRSINWGEFYTTQGPAVPPSFSFTIASWEEVIIEENLGGLYIDSYSNGIVSFWGAGPQPPVINLENEYLLIQNKTFTLDVTDNITSEGGNITYQWYFPDGTTYPDILGGNTPILNITGVESNAGLWSLEVTDDGGTTSHNLNLIYKKDTDGDGLNDEDETNIYYTNPNNSDTDEDGLTDFDELMTYSTDPTSADTDDDGLTDFNEVISFAIINGSFSWEEAKADAESMGGRLAVLDAQSKVNALNHYLDLEGLWPAFWIGATDNVEEGEWKWINGANVENIPWANYNGPNGGGEEEDWMFVGGSTDIQFGVSVSKKWFDHPENGIWNINNSYSGFSYLLEGEFNVTDPNDSDSDDDGLSDGDEVNLYSTDPNNQDTDNDNYLDANDAFPLDINEWLDTDGDNLGNNVDTDDDNDNYLDINDAFPLDASEWIDTDGDNIGNNADTDDDNDTILDNKEIEIGSNPLVLDTLESLVTIIEELSLNNNSKLSIDEIQDLRAGSTIIEVSGNQATVQLQMEESSDLQTWEDTGTPATMTIPADTETKFFRFKMAE